MWQQRGGMVSYTDAINSISIKRRYTHPSVKYTQVGTHTHTMTVREGSPSAVIPELELLLSQSQPAPAPHRWPPGCHEGGA